MTDGSIPDKERKRRVEKLDKKIDKADHRIGRLAADSGEAETDMNGAQPGGIGRVISKSSSTGESQEAVQGDGEEVVMVDMEPGQEGKR